MNNNKNKYSILFEYAILFILNSQDNLSLSQINNTYLYGIFVKAISKEINSVKSLTEKEIIEEFYKYKNNVEIRNGDIIFLWNKNKVIKNFKNYYITKEFIKEASEMEIIDENFLASYTKFDLLINPKYYFSGLLYKIIEKYVSSVLSKSSIYECFNIKKGQCPELEEEIFTKNIHNHIRYLPYNSCNDTGRTMKQFCLIIIDPSKQKMIVGSANKIIKNINNLYPNFQTFVNIVSRKHIFQHEHHHLCNNLLYFLYTNKSEGLNTPPKIVKDSKVTEIKDTQVKNEDIIQESGYVFEKMAYGRIKKVFTLKQLLFIGNENNDNLNIHEYRKKFIEISNTKNNVEELFKSYSNNNILGELVLSIYNSLKNELGKKFNEALDNIIMATEDDAEEEEILDEDDEEEIYGIYRKKDDDKKEEAMNPLEKFGENFIIRDYDHYDCHIKGTYFCSGKMFIEKDN